MESSMVRSVTVTPTPTLLTSSVQTKSFDRSCTDIVCFVVYLVLIGACSLAATGYVQRNPFHNKPYDVDHQPCYGRYRYLYIPSPNAGSVCVSFCPQNAGIPLDCQVNSVFQICPMSVGGLIRN